MANTEVARVVEEKREMARKERSANLWQNAFIVRISGFLVVVLRVVLKAFTDDVFGRALVNCFNWGDVSATSRSSYLITFGLALTRQIGQCSVQRWNVVWKFTIWLWSRNILLAQIFPPVDGHYI